MTVSTPALIFEHSRYKLDVRKNTAPLDILAFTGREALSQPFCYTIEFTSPVKTMEPAQMLMHKAAFTLHSPRVNPGIRGMPIIPPMPLRTLYGVISRFRLLSTSHDESRYEVTLVPRLALLANSHQSAIYQNMSVPEIVEKILRERHGFRGQDFLFTLARTYPKREQVMQYGEDDLRFVQRLLAEVGIWYKLTADERLKIDVVEFYDKQRHYQFNVYLPALDPSGMHGRDTDAVWGMETAHQVVEGKIQTRDYNYRDALPQYGMDVEADVTRGDPTVYGEAYHYINNYQALGNRYALEPEAESGVFYARLHHERYLNQQTRLRGLTSSPTLVPGQELKVQGEAPDVFRRGVIITEITSSARRDESFVMAFTAIPYSETVCFRPAFIPKPVMAGTLPARVSSTTVNDAYGDIDKDGLYRVSFDFDRATWPQGGESLWVRLARPYAGDTYGFHWPLLIGTEVAIAFEGGDPDRPYIAHALHDSKHPDPVTLYNYKRNVLRTPANNKLRMDDERGKEHIKLSTEYGGKSQLNLGHLVDSQRPHPNKRGEGFELRTDDWGAIRAGKGLFISADKQATAGGPVLEMQAAISLVKGAVNQVREWGTLTQTHLNPQPDTDSLKAYLQNVDGLKTAAMLLSAPEGIGVVSPQSVMLHSGQALYAQSAGDVHIASACRIGMNATQAISLLAQTEGMRLVSGKGPLTMESHGDELGLTALKDVTVQSTQGQVQIIAKNGLTLACGGAYIRLTPAGEIEIHGPGLLSLKGQHRMNAPAKQDFPLPDLPESVCKECQKKAQEMAQGFVLRK
ncbi:type VI secretion system Vgr family protein [Photorhabdus asymbiotica]|uniref:type VI secretion system Vgr family protein n=1 Tax=Photorhabdus asymbiotica TaxID=291112 RepID=UPI003DA71A83